MRPFSSDIFWTTNQLADKSIFKTQTQLQTSDPLCHIWQCNYVWRDLNDPGFWVSLFTAAIGHALAASLWILLIQAQISKHPAETQLARILFSPVVFRLIEKETVAWITSNVSKQYDLDYCKEKQPQSVIIMCIFFLLCKHLTDEIKQEGHLSTSSSPKVRRVILLFALSILQAQQIQYLSYSFLSFLTDMHSLRFFVDLVSPLSLEHPHPFSMFAF